MSDTPMTAPERRKFTAAEIDTVIAVFESGNGFSLIDVFLHRVLLQLARRERQWAQLRAWLEQAETRAADKAEARSMEPTREAAQAVYWHTAQAELAAQARAEMVRLEED